MDKEFIAMRKKGLVYDYGLQKWVKEPVGMYGDPALAQLFRPTKRALDVCHSTADGLHLWRKDSNGKYCFACGKRQ